MLEQRQRRGELGRQDVELVVRRVEEAQRSQVGEDVVDRQLVERDVQMVQLTQLEHLVR